MKKVFLTLCLVFFIYNKIAWSADTCDATHTTSINNEKHTCNANDTFTVTYANDNPTKLSRSSDTTIDIGSSDDNVTINNYGWIANTKNKTIKAAGMDNLIINN